MCYPPSVCLPAFLITGFLAVLPDFVRPLLPGLGDLGFCLGLPGALPEGLAAPFFTTAPLVFCAPLDPLALVEAFLGGVREPFLGSLAGLPGL